MERILLASDCTIYPIDSKTDLSSFQCGDSDLDEFFKNDAYLYSKQLSQIIKESPRTKSSQRKAYTNISSTANWATWRQRRISKKRFTSRQSSY